MASFTMQLTDGTTTINFDGTGGYSLIDSSWAPQRAQRSESEMGHVYEDVIETIPIVITGGSPAQVMERYAALSDLLDQAEAWGNDDDLNTAVLFKYQPNGSTLANPLETPIWREPGSPRMLSAPSTVNEVGYRGNVMTPVIVTFTRLGQLLGADETEVAAESTGNPAIMTTAAYSVDANTLSPYDLSFTFDTPVGPDVSQNMYILATNAASKLYFGEAEGLTLTNFSSQVITGSSAGSVAKSDATTTNTQTIMVDVFGTASTARLFHCFASIKNLSSTKTYKIRWGIVAGSRDSHVENATWSEYTVIDTSYGPLVVSLGAVAIPDVIQEVYLQAEISSAGSAGTDDLYVDYIAVIGMDESSTIFHLPNCFKVDFGAGTYGCTIEHQLDSKKSIRVYVGETAEIEFTGFKYNQIPFMTGTQISVLVLSTDGTNYVIESSGAEQDITVSTTRTLGYLTPQ